jgi:PAS domain S-box-containing protein
MSDEPERDELLEELNQARERIERLEAALRLRDEETFLAKLVDGLPTPVFARDANRRFVYLNRAASQHFGAPREQLLGKRLADLGSSPLCREPIASDSRSRDRSVLDGKPLDVVEHRLDFPDGPRRVVISRSRLEDPLNAESFVIGHVLDVTERRRAESELAETRALLEAAVEQSPAGVLLAEGADVRISLANPAALDILGGAAEQIASASGEELSRRWDVHFPDGEPCPWTELPLVKALLRGEITRNQEFVIRRLTGEDRWVSVNAAPIRDPDGQVKAGLVIFTDITETRQALQELSRSENLHRGLFENTGAATVIFDADGIIERCNSRFQILSGYSRSEIEGAMRWVDFVDPEDLARMQSYHQRRADLWAEPPPTEYEFTFLDRQNEAKDVYVQVDIIPGSRKRVASLVDVTERRRAEQELAKLNQNLEAMVEARNQELSRKAEELEQANARLTEMDAVKSGMLDTVSHDLRAPLTSVLGFAKLVDRDFQRRFAPLAGEDEKLLRYVDRIQGNLDIIQREGGRMARLINDFLDISRIESGRMEWRDQKLNASKVVDQAERAVAGTFDDNPELQLVVEPAPGQHTLQADPDRLQQVLVNLLDNAAKFSGTGEVRLSVSRQPEDRLRFTVQDSGPGIPQGDLDLIFDKFHRVRSESAAPDKPKGAGLGLAICRQIANHYGGGIWAESTLGQGSAFHLELPLAQEENGSHRPGSQGVSRSE